MRALRLLKAIVVVLATLGIVLPPPKILASDTQPSSKLTIKRLAPNTVLDVKLGSTGSLTGRTINHNGDAVPGTKVVLIQGKTEVAQATTDRKGNFELPNVKPGLYQLGSGATAGTYRVWVEKAAPPAAKPHCLLVLGENGARGQYGLSDTIAEENLGLILLVATTGLALAALIIALEAQRTADSADDNRFHSP